MTRNRKTPSATETCSCGSVIQLTALRFGVLEKALREWRNDHAHEVTPETSEPKRAVGFEVPQSWEFAPTDTPMGRS